MMTTNLIVIANVKQLRTGGSFRILLPFCRTSWGVRVLNSAIFNSFHNLVEFGTILEVLRNFGGGGGLNTPNLPLPSRYATGVPHATLFPPPLRNILLEFRKMASTKTRVLWYVTPCRLVNRY